MFSFISQLGRGVHRHGLLAAVLAAAFTVAATTPALAAPQVAVSILPLHSLTANLMRGVGEPALIMPAGQSPHGGQLKPSQVRQLKNADVIVWVGPAFEQALAKLIEHDHEHDHGGARVVTLLEAESMLRLPVREGGLWDAHAHGDEHAHGDDHGDDDEHAHDGHDDAHDDDHGHADAQGHGDEHGHDDEHGHGDHDDHGHDDHHDAHHGDHADLRIDPHIWLSVANARATVDIIARELTAADPANAAEYDANRRAMQTRLAAFQVELAERLRALEGASYVVFHDAYHYFEHEFDLHPLGALTVSPERPPGARRARDIKRAIIARGARCVFSEPQFQPGLARTLAADTGAKVGVLDPLGAALTPGPDAWFDLMRGLADGLAACASDG